MCLRRNISQGGQPLIGAPDQNSDKYDDLQSGISVFALFLRFSPNAGLAASF